MAITLDGTSGITTPDITSEAGLTVDGVSFASGAPANTLVTTSGGNVGIGTSSPSAKLDLQGTSAGAEMLEITHSGASQPWKFNSGENGVTNESLRILRGTSGEWMRFHAGLGTVFYYDGAERMRIDSSGNLLVGTTTYAGSFSGYRIHVKGTNAGIGITATANGDYGIGFNNASNSLVGNITINSSTTSYNTSSDYRLKENVVGVTGAAARVQQLNPVRFNFIADPDTTVDGFLAHEVQDVVPEAITGTKDAVDADGNPEYQGIDQSKLVPLLTAALQEALGKIETLEARVAALEAA